MNHALIYLNTLTIKVIIKLTLTNVYFKSIALTRNSMQRNTKRSGRLETNWFA